jgi:S1-C subfamily serine protease
LVAAGADYRTIASQSGKIGVVPSELSAAIEQVRPSVVQIRLHDAILGTGFFVDEQAHIVTAKHVLDSGRQLAQQAGVDPDFAAGMAAPNMEGASVGGVTGLTVMRSFTIIGCDVVDEDAMNDLALLRMRANPFQGEVPVLIQAGDTAITGLHGVAPPDLDRPEDGALVAASGYPLASDALVTNAGCIASAWMTDRDAAALLRMQDPRFAESVDRYLADLEVNGGNSGGPVYRIDTGHVVGVCVATQNAYVMFGDEQNGPVVADGRPLVYSSGLTIVVPAKYVTALLKQHDLVWDSPQG